MLKYINANEKKIIREFIDYVHNNGSDNIELEIDARCVAQQINLNPEVPDFVLADKFESLMNQGVLV